MQKTVIHGLGSTFVNGVNAMRMQCVCHYCITVFKYVRLFLRRSGGDVYRINKKAS